MVEQPEETERLDDAYYHPKSNVRENQKSKGVWGNICLKAEVELRASCFQSHEESHIWKRCVACGYSQEPGLDFAERCPLVTNIYHFRNILIGMRV
jgi:hypothetical protein